MCGRYYIDDSLMDRVYRDFPGLRSMQGTSSFDGSRDSVAAGRRDVLPSQMAPVILADGKSKVNSGEHDLKKRDNLVICGGVSWGYPCSGDLLINARAESIREKKMFSRGIESRRCVMPASGFYEWDRDKNQVTFRDERNEVIYLAGIYDLFDGEMRFVILTTAANKSMRPVHDRMPLMIEPRDVADWILEGEQTNDYLNRAMPQLKRWQKYEQQSLF